MCRIFILILFTIFSSSLLGQDPLNTTDVKGLKQGFWRKHDSTGHIIYEGRFKDGIPEGEFRYYYPNGKLKTVSMLSDHGKRAVTTSYFANGLKMASGSYLNEKKDSIWQFFNETDGTLVSEENYTEGLINGLSKVFYPDSVVSEIHFYKNGVADGQWEQYYFDGKIKLRGTYEAGDKQGLFNTFYNSGQLMITGQYNEGHQDGTWIYFNEKGDVSKKEIYKKGRLVKIEEPGQD
jgi:antitoxin component YwqK of YwqJK toxin-antitoxin module